MDTQKVNAWKYEWRKPTEYSYSDIINNESKARLVTVSSDCWNERERRLETSILSAREKFVLERLGEIE